MNSPKRNAGVNPPNLIYRWEGDSKHFPDIEDLARRLRFAPAEGRIWLDDRRSILMRNSAFGTLRREQIGRASCRERV